MSERSERAAPPAHSPPPGQPPAVLCPGAEFDGVVYLATSGRIEGRVRGDVLASDSLWIGEGGAVEGRVEASQVVVGGSIEGPVRARRRIEVLSTGRIRGDIETERLVVTEGSVIEGRCRTGSGVAGESGAPLSGDSA